MKKTSLPLLLSVLCSALVTSAQASTLTTVYSENYDGLTVGTGDLVVAGNPLFGSAAPDVTVDEWAVGHQTFSVADAGAGDHVLRLSNTNSSFAAAIWLDVSGLALVPGDYILQFTVSGYTLSGSGTAPTQFANVLKAKGVNASTADTVTCDLARGANFDNTVTTGGATIATNGSYLTSINPTSGSTAFSADGTVTHSFTITVDDEYIGLIIGNNDQNGQTITFDIDDLSVAVIQPTYPVLFEDDFDNRSSVLVDTNPSFNSALGVNEWAAGGNDWALVDVGGGDQVLRRSSGTISTGAAIWLDVGELGLVEGATYAVQFTVDQYTLSGSGTDPNPFINVVRASGIDDGTGSVTFDLQRGANFDPMVAVDALIGTGSGSLTETSLYPSGANKGAVYWSGNGTFSREFTVASSDEYIGFLIGAQDVNGKQLSFDLKKVALKVVGGEWAFHVDDYYEAADGTDWGAAVRRAVDAATDFTALGELNVSVIEFTQDQVYSMDERSDAKAQIELFATSRIRFEGNNAKLVSWIGNKMFALWRCEDVEINDLRLDLEPAPVTQGTVTGINLANDLFDVQIDSGYEYPLVGAYASAGGGDDCAFFDANGIFKHAWINILMVNHPAALPADTFRVLNDSSAYTGYTLADLSVGDKVAIKHLVKYPNSGQSRYADSGELMSDGAGILELRKCFDVTIKNVDSYAAYRQTVHTFGCGRLTFDGFQIMREPGTDNLVASAKGGLIMRSNVDGHLIQNCLFEAAMDDLSSFGVGGASIVQDLGSGTYELDTDGDFDFYVGATVSIYDSVNCGRVATARRTRA